MHILKKFDGVRSNFLAIRSSHFLSRSETTKTTLFFLSGMCDTTNTCFAPMSSPENNCYGRARCPSYLTSKRVSQITEENLRGARSQILSREIFVFRSDRSDNPLFLASDPAHLLRFKLICNRQCTFFPEKPFAAVSG